MSRFSNRGAIRIEGESPLSLRLVASNSETRKCSIEAMASSVETYLQRCSSTLVQGVDERISRYLRLIPFFMPLHLVMVGQEPYKPAILPIIASAFSFNPHVTKGYTPSVQVLSQFICMNESINVGDVADALACSYLLLPRGIACLNAFVSWNLNSYQRQRLQSYFSELVSDLLMSCSLIGSHQLKIVALGEIACKAIKSSIVSTPKCLIRDLRLKVSYLANPVFISRLQDPVSTSDGIGPSYECARVEARIAESLGCAIDGSPGVGVWNSYSHESLSLIGNPSSVEEDFLQLGNQAIGRTGEQTIAILTDCLREIPSNMHGANDSGRRGSERGPPDGVYLNVYKSLQTMLESGRRIEQEVLTVCRRADGLIDDAEEDRFLPLSSLVSSLNDLVSSLSVALAFYASMNPALTSTKSAIEMTGPSIPPIIRTRRSEPATPSRRVSFSDFLDEEDLGVESTDAESCYHEQEQEAEEDMLQSEEDLLPSDFSTTVALDGEQISDTDEGNGNEDENPADEVLLVSGSETVLVDTGRDEGGAPVSLPPRPRISIG